MLSLARAEVQSLVGKLKSHKLHGKKSASVFEYGHLLSYKDLSSAFAQMAYAVTNVHKDYFTRVLQDGDILILSFLLHFTSWNSSLKHFLSSTTLLNQDRVLSGKTDDLSIVSLHLPLLRE